MDAALLYAFAAGALMGLIISALGAGGSLFIIPILVYGFHQPVRLATGTSLMIVFAAALVGALGHARRGHVHTRVLIAFGVASMAGAVLGARLHHMVSEQTVIIVFAIVLVVASARMVFGRMPEAGASGRAPIWRVLPLGAAVGVLTGFAGVGGGFIIVPALIWGAGLSLRDAIGTSLAVIAMSSITGAATHIAHGNVVVPLAVSAGLGAVLGALLGAPLSGKVPDRPLRLGFGILVFAVAIYIIVRQL